MTRSTAYKVSLSTRVRYLTKEVPISTPELCARVRCVGTGVETERLPTNSGRNLRFGMRHIIIDDDHTIRGTQREYSSKPLKHSIVERILVFKR